MIDLPTAAIGIVFGININETIKINNISDSRRARDFRSDDRRNQRPSYKEHSTSSRYSTDWR